MCVLRHRYPCLDDEILAHCDELTPEQKRAIEELGEERRKQFETDPQRGFAGHGRLWLEVSELWRRPRT